MTNEPIYMSNYEASDLNRSEKGVRNLIPQ